MKTILKSSTSLSLMVMLTLPGGAFAQEVCVPDIGAQTYPCVLPNGDLANKPLDALAARVEAQEVRVDDLRLALQQAERGASEDPDAIRSSLEQAEDQLKRTRATIAEMEEAADQRAAEAEAEQEAAAEAQEQAAAEAKAESEAAAQEEEAQQAAAEAEAARQAAAQAEADQTAAQAEADQQAAAQAEADRQAAATAEQEQAKADRKAERKAQKEAEKQARREAKRQEALERQQSLAASDEESAAAEVETEALTEDNVRSSDEEFDTNVASSGVESKSDGDDGLSKFEKALLLGLGAVAVGQVLNNGDEVVSRSGDRVVVERDGDLRVLKNDDALLRQPGNDLTTETFNDGSTRTTVVKPDGARIVTIRGVDGTVLRRLRVAPNGEEVVLFDDTRAEPEIEVSRLPDAPRNTGAAPVEGEDALRAALQAQASMGDGQGFSLRQVREIERVKALAPEIQLDAVRFASGSAAIRPEQARSLARIGNTLRTLIEDNPRTVLLVEGHTDAVGDATYNLALSDRRAETVALALTEYFNVPPENMIVQGYGESQLKVPSLEAEQANRRALVRNITELLR